MIVGQRRGYKFGGPKMRNGGCLGAEYRRSRRVQLGDDERDETSTEADPRFFTPHYISPFHLIFLALLQTRAQRSLPHSPGLSNNAKLSLFAPGERENADDNAAAQARATEKGSGVFEDRAWYRGSRKRRNGTTTYEKTHTRTLSSLLTPPPTPSLQPQPTPDPAQSRAVSVRGEGGGGAVEHAGEARLELCGPAVARNAARI
ncbi:hypothetical protein DFP72DRAFT_1140029 [Ephemerocybe angulata]|uniref:Uncharacterized protein n=1 Tax=Ephemerocybe angulata TaxID=980116 RepID=A0A8H6HN08_9AGAR|nr:hypothetical protein DFP72DRAFT_1140029 [Tulosesus angulatus]